jgi:hypothetical protein
MWQGWSLVMRFHLVYSKASKVGKVRRVEREDSKAKGEPETKIHHVKDKGRQTLE